MISERAIISIIILGIMIYNIYRSREFLKSWFKMGWENACYKAGIPPYLEDKNVREINLERTKKRIMEKESC